MQVKRIGWLGTRTERAAEMITFLQTVLGLQVASEEEGFVALRLPNGDHVEVFRPDAPGRDYFTTGPVAGFVVEDIEAAYAALQAAGVELLSPLNSWADGQRSVHFRAPDGNVYELTYRPAAE